MDLSRINRGILSSLCRMLKITRTKTISAEFIQGVSSKLSEGREKSGKLDVLFNLLRQLGIDISHISRPKVEEGDAVHTYLLLDFLNLLFQALLSDNPAAFRRLVQRYERGGYKEQEGGSEGGGGCTTSGAEEVDKILADAIKKYGKIQSFRQKIDEQNISFIPKVPPKKEISEVDHVRVENHASSSSSIPAKGKQVDSTWDAVGSGSNSTTSTVWSSRSLGFNNEASSSSREDQKRALKKGGSLVMSGKENVGGKREESGEQEEQCQVNIRIPLEDTSINVKIKRQDGAPLGNRRIHVRLRRESSPRPTSKKIVYGTKSVLYHHHRKTRAPLFSRPPPAPRPTDKETLNAAVGEIKKRKRADEGASAAKAEADQQQGKRRRKDSVKLETQKYLREIRTRNGQLRKLALELNENN